MKKSESVLNIVTSLLKARKEFGPVLKDLTGQDGNRKFSYADLHGYISATEGALSKNDLFVMQEVIGSKIVTTLWHSSGEFLQSEEMDIKGFDTDNPKHFGAAISYARRYQYATFLGIASEDEEEQLGTRQAPLRPQQTQAKPVQIVNQPAPNQKGSLDESIRRMESKAPPQITEDQLFDSFGETVAARPYSVTFGKYKGKTLPEIDPLELGAYVSYLYDVSAADKKPMRPEAEEFCKIATQFLTTLK